MFSERAWLQLAIFVFLAGCGCGRTRQTYERLAVLPFENLTGDAALEWQGTALSAAIASQLTGSPHLKILGVQSVRELPESGATMSLSGYFAIEDGRLAARAVLEQGGRTRQSLQAADAFASGPLPLANALARAIEPNARPFGTKNTQALRAYTEALAAVNSPALAAPAFERAVNADPTFGEAYAAWAQWLLGRGDRAGAQQVFQTAREKLGQLGEVPRAQIAAMAEMLEGNYASRRHALLALARTTPADATAFGRLAALDVAARQFRQAGEEYRQALEREPSNPVFLNELGYAQAYAGDLDGAVKTLDRYRTLRPGDANALDSLGDVHFMHGRFPEAERFYLEANAKNPRFGGAGELEKAARARLMSGDAAGATGLFGRYLEARRAMGDAALEYRQAEWEILAGRRAEAAGRLEKLASSASPAAWLALVQLSALSLDSGDRENARRYAARAAATPAGKTQPLAALCAFAAAPSAPPAEWSARAEKTFPGPGMAALRKNALGFALIFDGHFREAVPVFEGLFRESAPASPDPVGVYLGWALIASGRAADARSPLALYPLPRPNAEQPFAVLVLPRVRELRAKAGLK